MDDVTIEIQARLNDQASQPLRALIQLSDRFSASLDAMRTRMSLIGAEAAALGASIARVSAAGGRAGGSSSGGKAGSGASGGSAGAAVSQEGASAMNNAALRAAAVLGELSGSAGGAGAALGEFSVQAANGAVRSGTAINALASASSAGAGGVRALAAAQQSASASARASASGFSQGAAAARSAAAYLSALGSAAGALSSRFSSFRLPNAAHADGGILTVPHIGMVAEDGPEAIIPLGGKRRLRGMELWKQAGRALGVRQYAEGSVPPVAQAAAAGINMGGVNVNISLNGSNAGDTIRQSSDRIADDVARAIAEGLSRALRNMA